MLKFPLNTHKGAVFAEYIVCTYLHKLASTVHCLRQKQYQAYFFNIEPKTISFQIEVYERIK